MDARTVPGLGCGAAGSGRRCRVARRARACGRIRAARDARRGVRRALAADASQGGPHRGIEIGAAHVARPDRAGRPADARGRRRGRGPGTVGCRKWLRDAAFRWGSWVLPARRTDSGRDRRARGTRRPWPWIARPWIAWPRIARRWVATTARPAAGPSTDPPRRRRVARRLGHRAGAGTGWIARDPHAAVGRSHA